MPSSAAQHRRERIQASAQYSNGSFRNATGAGPGLNKGNFMPMARDYFRGRGRRTPQEALPTVDPLPAWQQPIQSGLRATWLGHSTVLLEIDGVSVLTDPVWGPRASPSRFAGPKRFQPVPVSIAALPTIDAVVISHDHYDHLCHSSVMALAKRGVPFYTSLGVGGHLSRWGIPEEQITELDWWESATLANADLRLTAAPSQHFSGRGLHDRNRTLWSSFALQGKDHRVFFSGDTGLTEQYRTIAQRLGPFDLVMLEIGAFHPAWGDIHLGPDNALKALEMLGGGPLLPVHWGTFDLALHPWEQPAERLVELAAAQKVPLIMPRQGAAVEPASSATLEAWWRPIAGLANNADICHAREQDAAAANDADEKARLSISQPVNE